MNKLIIASSNLSYREDKLYFNQTALSDIIQEINTPFYLYSLEIVKNNLVYFQECAQKVFQNVSVHYAMKANSHPKILKKINDLDCGVDIVSIGEYKLALEAGIPPNKIVFSGIGKTEEEIEHILSSNNSIKSFNVESMDELELLQELSKKYNRKTPFAFRLNPGVNAKTHQHISTGGAKHKFGMTSSEIEMALAQEFSHLKLVGISIHIGSQLKDFRATENAINELLEILRRNEINDIEFIDFGGGLGISYGPNDADLTTAPDYFIKIKNTIAHYFSGKELPQILFEPGRFITGNAGILITKVIRMKDNGFKNFAILDSGMTELIRPALYDAFHEILPLSPRSTEIDIYDFVGPICETGDFFAKDRETLKIKKGDLLAIANCGSYARSMASNYNAREFAPEYFLEELS